MVCLFELAVLASGRGVIVLLFSLLWSIEDDREDDATLTKSFVDLL